MRNAQFVEIILAQQFYRAVVHVFMWKQAQGVQGSYQGAGQVAFLGEGDRDQATSRMMGFQAIPPPSWVSTPPRIV